MSEDGSSKGWRVDLLVEKLSNKVEEKLLLCSCCHGLLRDACICVEEFRCRVCIPEGVAWQPVKMNREIVNEKMIYCPLKSRGCDWSDTVSAAVHHLEDCVYLVRMEIRHIPGHVKDSCPLREIMCEFCEGKVKASEMNPHLEDCKEFPLRCPNGCLREGEDGVREVKRKDIPVHLDNHCPLQKVQCPYWDHGCREEMERRHTDAHEREFLHIHFKLSMTKTELKLTETTRNLDTANEKIAFQELQLTESLKRITLLGEQNSNKDLVPQLPTGRLE